MPSALQTELESGEVILSDCSMETAFHLDKITFEFLLIYGINKCSLQIVHNLQISQYMCTWQLTTQSLVGINFTVNTYGLRIRKEITPSSDNLKSFSSVKHNKTRSKKNPSDTMLMLCILNWSAYHPN